MFEFMDGLVFVIFWVIMIGVIGAKFMKTRGDRPGKVFHPTTINKPSRPPVKKASPVRKPTVASDGHRIPNHKDPTCEGQYGHIHEDMGPRYIVHEEPTTGYCILNGKKVALKDCWKY